MTVVDAVFGDPGQPFAAGFAYADLGRRARIAPGIDEQFHGAIAGERRFVPAVVGRDALRIRRVATVELERIDLLVERMVAIARDVDEPGGFVEASTRSMVHLPEDSGNFSFPSIPYKYKCL